PGSQHRNDRGQQRIARGEAVSPGMRAQLIVVAREQGAGFCLATVDRAAVDCRAGSGDLGQVWRLGELACCAHATGAPLLSRAALMSARLRMLVNSRLENRM